MGDMAAIVAPICVGVFVGVLSGLLGIGGGTVLVPIFRLMFGMSPMAATATSLFTIVPTSISGAVSHVKGGTCLVSLGLAMGLGGALTSPLGVWLAHLSPNWTIMLAAAVVIGYSAFNMITKALKKPMRAESSATSAAAVPGSLEALDSAMVSELAGLSAEEICPITKPCMTRKQLAKGFFIGLCAGVISGYVGVGGGFIMIPLMISVIGLSMRYASGTSLIAVILLAIPGVVEQGLMGNIDYWAGIAVAVGSIPGAVVGARLSRRVPERALRLLFGVFLLVAAVLLVLNETGLLG